MFSLFKAKPIANPPLLPSLDDSLYPITWQDSSFASPYDLLLNALTIVCEDERGRTDKATKFDEQAFHQILQANKVYQDWINFTVYGRYVQRSFSAFYQQTEDNFNADMPELLRHELQRHAQRLPVDQTFFLGGKLPLTVRQEKLLISTLSPYEAINRATLALKHEPFVINRIQTTSNHVLGFAVKHNKRTSERSRHEVIILDFNHLTLRKEEIYSVSNTNSLNIESERNHRTVLIRHYNLS